MKRYGHNVLHMVIEMLTHTARIYIEPTDYLITDYLITDCQPITFSSRAHPQIKSSRLHPPGTLVK